MTMDANWRRPMDRARLFTCEDPLHRLELQDPAATPRPHDSPEGKGARFSFSAKQQSEPSLIISRPLLSRSKPKYLLYPHVMALVFGVTVCGEAATVPAVRPAPAEAKLDEKKDEKVEVKELSGRIVAITKRSMSIEFDRPVNGADEALMPIDAKTKVERVKSLAELQRGDTIRVQYEQTYREDDKGERIILKTIARKIALIRSAPRDELGSREATSE